MQATVTQARLKEELSYDSDTGTFIWKKPRRGRRPGKPAGGNDGQGYIQIGIDGKLHRAHRLAWLYVYGEWPEGDTDHINGNRSDNRIANLRDISRSANSVNRKVLHGVNWYPANNKWRVMFRKRHIGMFADFFDACCARKSAENEFWQQN